MQDPRSTENTAGVLKESTSKSATDEPRSPSETSSAQKAVKNKDEAREQRLQKIKERDLLKQKIISWRPGPRTVRKWNTVVPPQKSQRPKLSNGFKFVDSEPKSKTKPKTISHAGHVAAKDELFAKPDDIKGPLHEQRQRALSIVRPSNTIYDGFNLNDTEKGRTLEIFSIRSSSSVWDQRRWDLLSSSRHRLGLDSKVAYWDRLDANRRRAFLAKLPASSQSTMAG